jgi:hypothetical protein
VVTVATGEAAMRAVAKRLALTAVVLVVSIGTVYTATHTHGYNAINTGVVLDVPGHGCVGVEYWHDTHSIDAYAGDVC